MKRRNLFISLAILTGVLFVSCEKDEQERIYEQKFNEQDRLIQSFIEEKGLDILSEYPESGVFEKNQFVLLDNGCYLHVIDAGNGNRAIPEETVVLMYITSTVFNLSWDYPVSYISPQPIRFTFGRIWFDSAIYDQGMKHDFLSEGVQSALQYVNENAKVRMLVPFDTRKRYNALYGPGNRARVGHPVGSLYQNGHEPGNDNRWSGNKDPFYYDEIVFQFESSESAENKLE